MPAALLAVNIHLGSGNLVEDDLRGILRTMRADERGRELWSPPGKVTLH